MAVGQFAASAPELGEGLAEEVASPAAFSTVLVALSAALDALSVVSFTVSPTVSVTFLVVSLTLSVTLLSEDVDESLLALAEGRTRTASGSRSTWSCRCPL